MNVLLLALQWIVSLIAVLGGIGVIIYLALKEDWKLGVACILFPPFLVYYIPTRWKVCRTPFVVFLVGFVVAALLQPPGSGNGCGLTSKRD